MSGVRSGRLTIKCGLSPGSTELITSAVVRGLRLGSKDTGLVHLFILTAGVALTLNENADPTAASDLIEAFAHIVPASVPNASALRLALIRQGVAFPVVKGAPQLGTWQGIHAMAVGNKSAKSGAKSGANSAAIRELVVLYSFIRSEDGPVVKIETAPRRGCHVISPPKFASHARSRSDSGTIGFGFCKHTSASIAWNAVDPLVGDSLENSLNTLVPEKWNNEFFEHTYEGPDDMPGHVKSTLIGAGVAFPVASTRPSGHIYLCEHRNTGGWGGGHNRKIVWLSVSALSRAAISVNSSERDDLSHRIEAASAEANMTDGLVHVSAMSGDGLVIASSAKMSERLLSHLRSILLLSEKKGRSALDMVIGQSFFLPLRNGKLCLDFAEESGEKLKVMLARAVSGNADACDAGQLLLHFFA